MASGVRISEHDTLLDTGRFNELITLLCQEHTEKINALYERVAEGRESFQFSGTTSLQRLRSPTCGVESQFSATSSLQRFRSPTWGVESHSPCKPGGVSAVWESIDDDMTPPKQSSVSCDDEVQEATEDLYPLDSSAQEALDVAPISSFCRTRTGDTKGTSSDGVALFSVRPAWVEQGFAKRISFSQAVPVSNRSVLSFVEGDDSTNSFVGQRLDACVLAPSSRKRLVWDFLSVVLVAYDVITVPLLAFRLSGNQFLDIADWCTRIFWTLDMPASCFVGFFHNGRLYLGFASILVRYLKTWFCFDFGLVFCDWVLHFTSSDQANGRGLVRLLRFARFARILRLLRLLKLQRVMHTLEDLIETESLGIYVRCVKPLVGLVFFAHFLACGWYLMGDLTRRQTYHNWLEFSGIAERSKAYQYATSFHWSLAQFTVSSMDVYAQNFEERVYTIFVWAFGMVMFSTIVGRITSALEQLRELKSDATRQFWLLRRYMKDYGISKRLSSRIIRHCDYAYSHRASRKQEKDVQLLQLLSEQLRQELAYEIHAPLLSHHPFFLQMARLKFKCLYKLSARALSTLLCARGDIIHEEKIQPKGMYIFIDGTGSYINSNVNSMLEIGDWICEACLYTVWITLGISKAASGSRLVIVDSKWYELILSDAKPLEWQHVQRYASKYVQILNEIGRANLSDVLDQVPIIPFRNESAREDDQQGQRRSQIVRFLFPSKSDIGNKDSDAEREDRLDAKRGDSSSTVHL